MTEVKDKVDSPQDKNELDRPATKVVGSELKREIFEKCSSLIIYTNVLFRRIVYTRLI